MIPFQGADPLVVRSSQRSLSMRMEQYYWPQYNAYTTLNTAYNAAATSLYGTVFSSLAASPWGRSLLMAYPETFADGVFSKEGPTQEHLDTTTFQVGLPLVSYCCSSATSLCFSFCSFFQFSILFF